VLAMVVDDSRAMRMILCRILASLGYETLQADNGRSGLEVLRSADALPVLVLVDWNMPEMDGIEFISAVRAQESWLDVTLMMVTTEGDKPQVARAFAAGAHEYVTKPFTAETIQQKLTLLGLPDAVSA